MAGDGDVGPTINCAKPRLNPPVTPGKFWLRVKLVRLNEPEPDQTTSGPTCETVRLKLPDTPGVVVGVGVTVLVGVIEGVLVGVLVGVEVGVTVLVGVTLKLDVGVDVTVGVLVGVGDGEGSTNIKYSSLPTLMYSSKPANIGLINTC